MHIAVMGSGAVGGFLGVQLASNNIQVSFIARGDHLAAMKANGLIVQGAFGDMRLEPVQATDDPENIGPVDIVLFAVKTYDMELAAETCRPLLKSNTGVLALQNGVDSIDMLSTILGRQHVLGGAIYLPAGIVKPGVIQINGPLAKLIFGELDGSSSERASDLLKALNATKVETTLSDHIIIDLWEKFIPFAAFSGVASLARCPMGALRSNSESRQLLTDALQEVVAVARAKGIDISDDSVASALKMMLEVVPDNVKPSTLLDLEKGNRLEVPWISGTVVRLGQEMNIPTPINSVILAALTPHIEGKQAAA